MEDLDYGSENIVMNELINCYNRFLRKIDQHSQTLICFSIIFYKIAMEIFYTVAVTDLYAYEGMRFDFNLIKYLISWLLCGILILFCPKKLSIESVFIHFQLIVTVIPMLVYFSFCNQSTAYMFLVVLVLLIQMFILNHVKIDIGVTLNRNWKSYTNVVMAISVPLLILMVYFSGNFYGLKMFDSEFLYYIRANTQYSIVIGYISTILYIAIIPFFLLYTLEKRKYYFSVCLFLANIFLFMILGNKVIVLMLIVIVLAYIATKLRVLLVSAYIGVGLVGILLSIGYALEKNLEIYTHLGISFLGERFLFGPSMNKFAYYDFFNIFPFVGYADTQYANIFDLTNLYAYDVGNMITSFVTGFGLNVSNSLTGYLGESYGQCGIIGLIFTGILVAVFVKIIAVSGKGLNKAVVYPLIVLWVVLLNDTSFRSTLITCGWVIIIVFFIIYGEEPSSKIVRGDLGYDRIHSKRSC